MSFNHFFLRLARNLRDFSSQKSMQKDLCHTDEAIDAASGSTFPPICPAGSISGLATGKCMIAQRRIQYGVQVGFEETRDSAPRHAGVRGWAIDLDTFKPAGVLCVTTEKGVCHRFLPTDARVDALNHAAVPKSKRPAAMNCGFSGYLPDAGNQTTLTLEMDGEAHLIGTGHPERPQVLVGKHGWLFLSNDSNDSIGQFTTDHRPSDSWLRGWETYFTALKSLRESKVAGKLIFVIAPSKETIFPDYYPFPRGNCSPLDNLLARHGDAPEMFYPADVLSSERELSFDKAETHWTDFGARRVCQEILHRWQTPNPPVPLQFLVQPVSGDLGWKTVPPVTTFRTIANWPNSAAVIFDNFALHHGRVRVTINPQARKAQTCVIFGGSSAEHMERYLTAIFARVVYVYSAGAWDPAILRHERPAFTVLQSSERFLTRAPSPEIDNAAIVASKIAAGHTTRKEARAKVLAEWTDPSIAFYKEMG
jgi:hypothetical protein